MVNNDSKVLISFIIPALNEEGNIGPTIDAILAASIEEPFEIIVSDNGSKDNTLEIAESKGAKVIQDSTLSIGGLRNYGVAQSSGSIIVFLDADVRVRADWYSQLKSLLPSLLENPLIITGSKYTVPEVKSFIERYWFDLSVKNNQVNYINSGHMITTRILFDRINGFDDKLRTAEDYDFCIRAKKQGAIIRNEERLVAIHMGYPKTIKNFMIREIWHGREDYLSLQKIVRSKVALVSIGNGVFLLLAVALSLIYTSLVPFLVYFSAAMLFSFSLNRKRFEIHGIRMAIFSSLIFYLYLVSRLMSPIVAIRRPKAREVTPL